MSDRLISLAYFAVWVVTPAVGWFFVICAVVWAF